MKLLLVSALRCPDAEETFGSESELSRMAKLAPMYLSAAVKAAMGSRVEISYVDLTQRSMEELIKTVATFQPDVVGLSSASVDATVLHAAAAAVSKAHDCFVISGGPYPTSAPDKVLADDNVDLVVIGEGEATIVDLLTALEEKRDLASVKGIQFKKDGAIVVTEPRPPIEDLDSIPFPDYELVDVDQSSILHIFTTRGCPLHCSYCHHIFGKRTRYRSAQNVVDELRHIVDTYGQRFFRIADDNFNMNRKRMLELCNSIVRENMDLALCFTNGLKGDALDEEMVDALAKAGTCFLSVAVESANPRLLKLVNKPLDLDRCAESITLSTKAGIITNTFNMLGFPTETKEEVWNTIQYNLDLPHQHIVLFIVSPQPGTALYDLAVERGYKDFTQGYYAKEHTSASEHITGEELNNMRVKAYLDFFLGDKRVKSVMDQIAGLDTNATWYNFKVRTLLRPYSRLSSYLHPKVSADDEVRLFHTHRQLQRTASMARGNILMDDDDDFAGHMDGQRRGPDGINQGPFHDIGVASPPRRPGITPVLSWGLALDAAQRLGKSVGKMASLLPFWGPKR